MDPNVSPDKIPPLITLLGPTAVGKTALAARLAHAIGAEVISADSRQVFRGMDIGTGKDKSDYLVDGLQVPVHLIDIADAGSEYSVYNFVTDFNRSYDDLRSRGKPAVLCGGTGLYLEAVLRGYDMVEVPENETFRASLKDIPEETLLSLLEQKRKLHNTSDSLERSRLIRALEIEQFKESRPKNRVATRLETMPVFGLWFERAAIRERITQRLKTRLGTGLVLEVEALLHSGIPAGRLFYYGLEYKYVTQYLLGDLREHQMFRLLNTAIHQFAKRQMTWFRRMERSGIKIQWLEGENGADRNLDIILAGISNS